MRFQRLMFNRSRGGPTVLDLHHALAIRARKDFSDRLFPLHTQLRVAGHALDGVGLERNQIPVPSMNSLLIILSTFARFANPNL